MAHSTKNSDPCPDCDNRLTYLCEWCGKRSLKEQWGPGMVTCPKCGRVAPSAGELQTMLAVGIPSPIFPS